MAKEKKVNSAVWVQDGDAMVGRALTTPEEVEAHGFGKEDLARLEREGAISGFVGEALPEESEGEGAFGPEGAGEGAAAPADSPAPKTTKKGK